VASTAVTCAPTANCSGAPTTITVVVTETADSRGSVYQYSLTGNFRKLNGAGPPIVPQSMILLGAGNCTSGATGIKVAGGSSMRVYGTAMVNTADGSTCKAMSLGTDAG